MAVGVSDRAPVAGGKVVILSDAEDTTVSSPQITWAINKLQRALIGKKYAVEAVTRHSDSRGVNKYIVLGKPGSKLAQSFPSAGLLDGPESTSLTPGRYNNVSAILVSGADVRGFVYGILELAERVHFGLSSGDELNLVQAVQESPANNVRSIARAFCSEIEDKSWYYDKDFWRAYLDLLATSRFNRFNFALGFGYDFPTGVTGDYFHFPYPYLVDVPGYKVRVVPSLENGEREKNLETLQFIAAETANRGIQFQLGLWTHAYQWTNSPNSDHHIEGLTAETHAPYCRDALAMLLKACPEIEGLTLRVHGESGIPEGSYPFWETLFQAISGCGRKVEIDMHAKGINQIMIDMATKTGMPIKIGAKWWAEHMGLGYHQADIRELEVPRPDRMESGVFNVSNGERRFTRYGYADLFQVGRKYDVLFRLWPGTQRHLLWGDPDMAAAYGKRASFCGASGMEICEPLTFKGREGSGHPGGRCAYRDASLNPKNGDFEKFEYTYRLWGRLLYNPESNPDTWRRYLRTTFGSASKEVEATLSNSGRVLPLITTASLPSAANHSLWVEVYENMPIVLGGVPSPYSDTPDPKCFATVSPLDPQLFSSVAEYADVLLSGRPSPKYSPVEVAQWLETLTESSERSLAMAQHLTSSKKTEFRRMEEDVLIQNGVGKFFAGKLRSGLYFALYERTGDPEACRLALLEYQKARTAWSNMAERAKSVYVSDISYGSIPLRRGDWAGRLVNIDRDIAAMQERANAKPGSMKSDASAALKIMGAPIKRPVSKVSHTPPAEFRPGQELTLSLKLQSSEPQMVRSAHLYYRHVNQGERWKSVPMVSAQGSYKSAIPAAYTDSVYPLQYYFEFQGDKVAWLSPGFNEKLSNQPYYVISKRSS